MNITGETPLAALTVSQFVDLLDKHRSTSTTTVPARDYTQGYAYGLKGIRKLFGVSHATAQRYKDTILKPAIRQNGRKIVVDVAKALELFDEYSNQ